MSIKLELELHESKVFFEKVFGTESVSAGQTTQIEHGITLTNMTAGGQGVAPSDIVTFVVENYQSISAGVASAALYDLIKGVASSAYLNGRKILSSTDIENEIGKDNK